MTFGMLNDMPADSKGKNPFLETDWEVIAAWGESVRKEFRDRILAATRAQTPTTTNPRHTTMNTETEEKIGTVHVIVKMAFKADEIGDESADSFLAMLIQELPISIGDGIPLFVEFLRPKIIPA